MKIGHVRRGVLCLYGCDRFLRGFLAFATRFRLDVEPTVQKSCKMPTWLVKRFWLHETRWHFTGISRRRNSITLDEEGVSSEILQLSDYYIKYSHSDVNDFHSYINSFNSYISLLHSDIPRFIEHFPSNPPATQALTRKTYHTLRVCPNLIAGKVSYTNRGGYPS